VIERSATHSLLQRCDGSAPSTCPCHGDKTTLRRSGIGTGPAYAPDIVQQVLAKPGAPLDWDTRGTFEAGFGHDFTQVRIHAGPDAGAATAAVNARAFTVGRHLVFGTGQYAPRTSAGMTLLAHELTHSVQQDTAVDGYGYGLRLDDANSLHEQEARRTAATFLDQQPAGIVFASQLRVARDQPTTEKVKAAVPANHAYQTPTPDEVTKITAATGATASAAVPSFPEGPRFVIHDTAARHGPEVAGGSVSAEDPAERTRRKTEATRAEEERVGARGPLLDAAAAYVLREGEPVIARPKFFDPDRPTSTAYEKRQDMSTLESRERAFERIWGALKPDVQTKALSMALAAMALTPATGEREKDIRARAIKERSITPSEVKSEVAAARKQLESTLPAKYTASTKPQIMTTASWTIAQACGLLKGVAPIDLAKTESDAQVLKDTCDQFGAYFAARDPRLGSMVNVEIYPADVGSDCATEPSKLLPMPTPAYEESQYDGVKKLYLMAILQAGKFPEIVTHFWVDRQFPDGHCDPRCFRLQHLYDLIAAALGHPAGSRYGQPPLYGTSRGKHNVWWIDKVDPKEDKAKPKPDKAKPKQDLCGPVPS
jgi:hypothetical protein